VVFSQHRAAVRHVDFVLSHANVPHVTICKGDHQANQEVAVATWTQRPSCRVFLLHAGAAAAGLTLVAARHIFLLEPFDKPGQELQALNRCHRIGQSMPVQCTIYYARRTVEERLLAYRELEQKQVPQLAEAGAKQGGESEPLCLLAEGAALPSSQKLRYLFGMLRRRQRSGEGNHEDSQDSTAEAASENESTADDDEDEGEAGHEEAEGEEADEDYVDASEGHGESDGEGDGDGDDEDDEEEGQD